MTTPTQKSVVADNTRISYVEGGRADKPAAVLLHGWIASHRLYRKVWPQLGELLQYRALDLPGFGASDKPDPSTHAYDAGWYAEKLRAYFDATGTERAILMAQSMGGIVATEFAARYPNRVERLILIDSAGIPMPPPLLGRILQLPVIGQPLFMALGGTRKSVGDFFKNDVWYVAQPDVEDIITEAVTTLQGPGGREAAYATLMRVLSPAATRASAQRFSSVSVPTRLIWGAHDKLFPVEACARVIERSMPSASLDVIAGSGHEPPVETPEAFIASLARALA